MERNQPKLEAILYMRCCGPPKLEENNGCRAVEGKACPTAALCQDLADK
jgi:hypothetical protein